MYSFKRIFAPQEVKEALGVLEEASYKFQNDSFQNIRKILEKELLNNSKRFVQLLQKKPDRTPQAWVYSQIGNIAGDMLESGQYHIYRGVLNPMGPGDDLVKIFDATYDKLLKIKYVDLVYAKQQKEALRKNIKQVG